MVIPMNDSSHFWIVSGVTFFVFFGEALIHYNYGILESKNLPWRISNFTIPKGKSLLKMSAIVVIASALSGIVIDRIEQKA